MKIGLISALCPCELQYNLNYSVNSFGNDDAMIYFMKGDERW